MLIEQALLTALLADTNLMAHVNERIYYITAPQIVATPYITFFKVDAGLVQSHQGNSHFSRDRFQFDIFHETFKEVKDIGEHLKTLLIGKDENIGTGDVLRVSGILFDDENQFYENDTRLYHLALDFIVPHEE